MSSRICIVVLCGLPGAGKTTFAKKLISYTQSGLISQESNEKCAKSCKESDQYGNPNDISASTIQKEIVAVNSKLHLKHICFDCVIPNDVYSADKNGAQGEQTWKKYRHSIYQNIEEDILTTLNLAGASPERHTSVHATTVSDAYRKIEWNSFPATDGDDVCVFLLDDNMFYRSMRQQYYQLARKYNLGFAEIYVHCSLDLAQQRNAARPDSVSNDTVINMSSKLEAPDESCPWERHSLSLPAEGICLIQNLNLAVELIITATEDPVQSLPEADPSLAEGERTICSLSTLHQADLILRKLIGLRMNLSEGISKTERHQQADTLNVTRKHLLDDFKTGSVVISLELQSNVAKSSADDSSPLYAFVKKTFEDRLNVLPSNS